MQATENGTLTKFIGSHYEVTGSQVTKYYMAGTSRIAMRKYTVPSSMSVEYLLSDHLGSTSVTTDNTGAKVSEMRYKPWGEVRYSWTAATSTTPDYSLADYTFTGQYSYMDDPYTSGVTEGFDLMFYNARWYDPGLGRFAQADSIIPESQGVQAWDRYAYTNNNPVRYTDPTGHCLGLVNCIIQTLKATGFLMTRRLQNGELTDGDYEDAADFAAPAIASGSKESLTIAIGEFVTVVKSTTVITAENGDVQVFDEMTKNKNDVPMGVGLPGVTIAATHGYVFGLNGNALNYGGDAVQLNLGIPVAAAGGVTVEGYTSPDFKVGGVDVGPYVGFGPTIIGGARTTAYPNSNGILSTFLKKILPDEVHGRNLLICRMVSMCGAK